MGLKQMGLEMARRALDEILIEGERVELAFDSKEWLIALTNKRMITRESKFRKKGELYFQEYEIQPYASIRRYAITCHNVRKDEWYLDLEKRKTGLFIFRTHTQADIFAIQRVLAKYILR
ncbi:MAG: PH domain-containing protein [Turicibacter sp.]|nr:PH domain-containing protein [Turicibacter sp.]